MIARSPLCAAAFVLLVLLGAGLAGPAALAQQRVGVNGAVNPNAMGTPPGAMPRRLVLGQDVVFNERITTQAAGQTQILFVDESAMTIGPNADMVIDAFVYDPHAGAGKLAASLTRGVFRFVGGKLSKQADAVTMRTPTATIGIRGGVVLVDQKPNGQLEVIKVFGQSITVTGLNHASQTITRNGFETRVSGPGAAPSDPGPAPPGAIAGLLGQLDGRPGGNGGAPVVPTEITVASSGIANTISSNIAAGLQAAARTQPLPVRPENVTPAVQQAQLNNQNVSFPAATATPVSGGPAVPVVAFFNSPTTPGTPVPTPSLPGISVATPQPTRPAIPAVIPPVITPPGGVDIVGFFNPPTPPVVVPPVVVPPVVVPPVVVPPVVTPPVVTPPVVTLAGLAGNYADTGAAGPAKGFSGSLRPYAGGSVSNGTFAAGLSSGGMVSFPLAVGTTTLAASGAGTASPLGPVTGTTFLSADESFFYADLTPVGSPAQREFIYGGTPVNPAFYQATANSAKVQAFQLQPDAALQSNIPFIRQQTGGGLSGASVSPLILATPANSTFSTPGGATKALQASLAITGSAAQQNSVLVVMVGNVFDASLNGTSPAQPILNGIVHGSYLANAAGQPIRINSPYVTAADANGNSFYGAKAISGFALTNGNCCSPSEVPSQAFETNTANQAVTNYQFAQPAVPTAVPAAANGTQTTQTLSGWFGGVMTKEPGSQNAAPIPYTITGQTQISTNAQNAQVAATLTHGSSDPPTSSASGINSMTLGFGSTTGSTSARIAYVNDRLFAAFENSGTPSSVNGAPVPVNNQSNSNNGANIYLVTQTAAPPTALLPNGLCACQYLQWGYWGGELDTPAFGGSAARTDVGHINSWVAGMPTPATDMSILQNVQKNYQGNYTGGLFGSVVNNGAQYLASGGLNATYNFANQTGSFTVSHYDVLPTFTATGKAPLTGSNYTFAINKSGITGSVNGSFYGPMAAETGGNFAFAAGPTYMTSGIFAAKGIVAPKP